jgi:hypothetical protein
MLSFLMRQTLAGWLAGWLLGRLMLGMSNETISWLAGWLAEGTWLTGWLAGCDTWLTVLWLGGCQMM